MSAESTLISRSGACPAGGCASAHRGGGDHRGRYRPEVSGGRSLPKL